MSHRLLRTKVLQADPHKLAILTELRRAKGITLEQMAQACGLRGRRSRESVAHWERGESIPHTHHRTKFIDYLGNTLRLRSDPQRFQEVWSVLVEEWRWEPLSEAESQQFVAEAPEAGLVTPEASSAAPMPDALHAALVLVAQLPTGGPLPLPAALPPGSRMLFSRNPLFVGRWTELRALATALTVSAPAISSAVPTVAVTGLPGIGKTQLTSEFVHRYGQFFAGGVFWLSFADANAVPIEVAVCGNTRHMSLRPDFRTLPLDQQIRLVREAWESPLPRLLIFDNCDDPGLLAFWRSQSGGCRVLVTSRRSGWDATLGVSVLPLSTLSRRESVRLLRKHCPDLSFTNSDLIAIAAELEDLPLALHLAGRFLACHRQAVTPADYLQQLRGSALLQHPSLQGGGISPTGHQQHIARAFALSYDRLNPADPTERLALALLARAAAFAPGAPIPRDLLLESLAPPSTDPTAMHQAEDALTRLIAVGLLEPTIHATTDPTAALRMHRLLVAFVQQTTTDESAQAAVEQVISATTLRLNTAEDVAGLMPLQAHLRAVTNAALQRRDARAADLCYQLSLHLYQLEDYTGAHSYNQRSLDIREALFGETSLATVENLHHLGWMLDGQGHYAEAQPCHERALAIRRATLGDEHLDIAESFNYVGTIMHARCDYRGARYHYEQALAIREHLLGRSHTATAQSLNNLGLLLHALGRYAEALRYHERALAIREQVLDAKHVKLAITLNNLGYLLRAMGRYAQAQHYLERALAIREHVYGPNHGYPAVTLNHLGRLYHSFGDYWTARYYLA